MASTMASSQLQNFLQAFLMVLFKSVNAAIILAFNSSLVLLGVLLVSRSITHNNQRDCNLGVRWPDVKGDVVAEIYSHQRLGSLVCMAWWWLLLPVATLSIQNSTTSSSGVMTPVTRHRVFQQPPSQSRAVLPPPGTWCSPPCWIWGHVGRWMEA